MRVGGIMITLLNMLLLGGLVVLRVNFCPLPPWVPGRRTRYIPRSHGILACGISVIVMSLLPLFCSLVVNPVVSRTTLPVGVLVSLVSALRSILLVSVFLS